MFSYVLVGALVLFSIVYTCILSIEFINLWKAVNSYYKILKILQISVIPMMKASGYLAEGYYQEAIKHNKELEENYNESMLHDTLSVATSLELAVETNIDFLQEKLGCKDVD